jgi:riboflavin synthase alpha subunit
MFTGLIAELGRITAVEKGESSAVFTIAAPAVNFSDWIRRFSCS